ncbi:hypothetical protein ElyMa_000203300 [Elysia marginata]|uniref:C3H1-type domain-containing protein n=1 Tax=Elysia marginata TaxID=1093978 RepID=A0AAV4EW74_9GAST|nr:hypothetical protein ElyMa_000203300 [Elysia marginata]
MDLSDLRKNLPTGSSAYAQVLAEIQEAPGLQVSTPDDEADGSGSKKKHHHHHHHNGEKEGKIVHGLHHCYKIEGGHCHATYGCNHLHTPAGDSLSPAMARRRSVSMLPGQLHVPEDIGGRSRSNSDAAGRRRLSIPANHLTSPARSHSGSLADTPEEPGPGFNRARRGSNVVLHSGELPIVYNQLKGK